MSGPLLPFAAITGNDELRRRFAVWTLAIVSTLTGTGSVQLNAAAWIAEEPPAGSTSDDKKADEKKDAKTDEQAAERPTREEVLQLVRERKFDEAADKIDYLLRNSPNVGELNIAYTSAMQMPGQQAKVILQKLVSSIAREKPTPINSTLFQVANTQLANLLQQEGNIEEALALTTKALEDGKSMPNFSPGILLSTHAKLLKSAGVTTRPKP